MDLSQFEVLSFLDAQCLYPGYSASIDSVIQGEFSGSREIIHIKFTFISVIRFYLAYIRVSVFPLPPPII